MVSVRRFTTHQLAGLVCPVGVPREKESGVNMEAGSKTDYPQSGRTLNLSYHAAPQASALIDSPTYHGDTPRPSKTSSARPLPLSPLTRSPTSVRPPSDPTPRVLLFLNNVQKDGRPFNTPTPDSRSPDPPRSRHTNTNPHPSLQPAASHCITSRHTRSKKKRKKNRSHAAAPTRSSVTTPFSRNISPDIHTSHNSNEENRPSVRITPKNDPSEPSPQTAKQSDLVPFTASSVPLPARLPSPDPTLPGKGEEWGGKGEKESPKSSKTGSRRSLFDISRPHLDLETPLMEEEKLA